MSRKPVDILSLEITTVAISIRLNHEHIDKIVDWSCFELFTIKAEIDYPLLALRRKNSSKIGFKFCFEQWNAFLTAQPVANGIFHHDFIQSLAIVEFHRHAISNGTFFGIVIVMRELWIFDTYHLLA